MLEPPQFDEPDPSFPARRQQPSRPRLPGPIPRPINLEWRANRDYQSRCQNRLTQVDGEDSVTAFRLLSRVPCVSVQNPFGAPWCYFSTGLGPDVSGIPIVIEVRAYSDSRQKMWVEYDSTDTQVDVIPGEPGAFKRSDPVEVEASVWRDYSFILNDLTCTRRINGSDFRVVCTQHTNQPFYVHSITMRRALPADPKTYPSNLTTELGVAVKTLSFYRPENPDLSIIIPFYGGLLFTQQCLLHLRQNTLENFEVILVDDGSPAEVSTALRSIPGITLVSNDQNLGFAKACNKGASLARGSELVFLNNDTIPQSYWLRELLACSGRFPNAGVIGSKLLYPESKLVQHAGMAFDSLGNPFHEYRCSPRNALSVTTERAVPAVTGACMLTPREVFEQLDGFDEGFKNGFEDTDYCLRVGDSGKDVIYCPTSELLHYESVSEGRIDYHQELANLKRLKQNRAEVLKLNIPKELSLSLKSKVKSDNSLELFDWKAYIDFYPDLWCLNKEEAKRHWERYGQKEGRLSSKKDMESVLNEPRTYHQYKCIHVHIPKCAGTSIDLALSKRYAEVFDKSHQRWVQHATAKQIHDWYCSTKVWSNYFKFGFVRNPFDRIVSSYHWLCKEQGILESVSCFRDFVFKQGPFESLLDPIQKHLPQNRYHQVQPAANYLLDGDVLLVDFVGRFEKIEKDWNFICNILNHSLVLPHKNKTQRQHYKKYYTAETRRKVEQDYAVDLEMFNYRFE